MTLELHVREWRGPQNFSMGGIHTLLAQGYEVRVYEAQVYKGKFIKATNRWGFAFLKAKEA